MRRALYASSGLHLAVLIWALIGGNLFSDTEEDPFELTGLYDGVALTARGVDDLPGPPDTVWLFRRPILDEWIDRGDVALEALVAHVLVHELAHHFGWSDEDIATIDRWWE